MAYRIIWVKTEFNLRGFWWESTWYQALCWIKKKSRRWEKASDFKFKVSRGAHTLRWIRQTDTKSRPHFVELPDTWVYNNFQIRLLSQSLLMNWWPPAYPDVICLFSHLNMIPLLAASWQNFVYFSNHGNLFLVTNPLLIFPEIKPFTDYLCQ